MSNCETEGPVCTLSVTCRFKVQDQRVGIGWVFHSGDFCRQSHAEGRIKPKFCVIQENLHKSIKVPQPLISVPKPLLSPMQTYTNLSLLRESYCCFLKKKKSKLFHARSSLPDNKPLPYLFPLLGVSYSQERLFIWNYDWTTGERRYKHEERALENC